MNGFKYRAWDGEKMVSPDYIDRGGIAWWKENSIPTYSSIIMQFTGMQDKNSKDIYAGDILENKKYGGIMLVRWGIPNETYAGWCVEWIKDCPTDRPTYDLMYYADHLENCEVIGNKYENQELLPEVKE